MKKLVIYTAVFGGYDDLKPPLYPEAVLNQADLVCLTDSDDAVWPWISRKITLPVADDPVKSGRHCKILTHRYFPDYESSIYLDGNMRLVCPKPAELVDQLLRGSHLAGFPNSYDQCLYKEAERVVALGLEKREVVETQINRYRAEGFPENFGKINANILVRRHNQREMISFSEQWWKEVEVGASRDQLSFDYIRWKSGLAVNFLQGMWTNNPIAFREAHRKPYLLKSMPVRSKRLSWAPVKDVVTDRVRATASRIGRLGRSGIGVRGTEDRGLNKHFRAGRHRLDLGSCHPEVLWAKAKNLTGILEEIQPALKTSQPRFLNIGAGIGVFEACMAQRFPLGSYISYEPDPARFSLLSDNTKDIPGLLNPVELHQSAVGTSNGYVKFHKSNYSNRVALPGDDSTDTFPMCDIAEVCGNSPDFIRLNAPGLTFAILERMANCYFMQQLQGLLIGYHRVADLPDQLASILFLLHENGFRYHVRNQNFPHPSGSDEIRDRIESVYRILAIRFALLI